MEQISIKQRDIILVNFPFSDQYGGKVRPALVISNNSFNASGEDVVICAITGILKETKYSLGIDSDDIEEGKLYDKSLIKVETLVKRKKSLILKRIAILKELTFKKVQTLIYDLIKSD